MAASSNDNVRNRRPGIGVGVFITSKLHSNCIVLGRRKGSTGSGTYAVPGGHLEFGEEWAECAKRESEEETGLKLKNVQFATVVNAICREKDYHYVTIFMKAEVDLDGIKEPENMEPDKCEGWEWTDWNKFPDEDQLFWPLTIARHQGYNPFNASTNSCHLVNGHIEDV